ncbi:hypothetical protein CN450_03750 [Bacillus cereus]|nr:hypothetical protein CN450_03750 [Bacillus cereus]
MLSWRDHPFVTTNLFYRERNTKYYMCVQSIACILTNKGQLAKANCPADFPRGKGERLGISLNELWPSPIYIIDGILSFI